MRFWFAVFFLFSLPAQAETITIVGDPWCPYNCEPGTEKPGFMVDVAREIFKEKDIDVVYKVVPWARAIEETRKGQYDGTIGGYKEDTPDFVFPTNGMIKAVDAFYTKADNTLDWHYEGAASLEKVSLAVIKDYSYGKAIDDYIATHKKDMSKIQFAAGDTALEQNVKKLLADRVQVVVENSEVMRAFLDSSHQNEKIKLVGKQTGENIYIAFSPHNPKSQMYADILSDGIKRYKESGKLKAIKDKYGMK